MNYLVKYRQLFEHDENQYFITIDPGMRQGGGTAVAVFTNGKLKDVLYFKGTSGPAMERTNHICKNIIIVANSLNIQATSEGRSRPVIFIEKPIFEESLRGLTAAKTDSLFKLIFIYSRIYQIFQSKLFIVEPLAITHWKGQISKAMTKSRLLYIIKEYPKLSEIHIDVIKEMSGDEIDAIAMGFYLLGKFK